MVRSYTPSSLYDLVHQVTGHPGKTVWPGISSTPRTLHTLQLMPPLLVLYVLPAPTAPCTNILLIIVGTIAQTQRYQASSSHLMHSRTHIFLQDVISTATSSPTLQLDRSSLSSQRIGLLKKSFSKHPYSLEHTLPG